MGHGEQNRAQRSQQMWQAASLLGRTGCGEDRFTGRDPVHFSSHPISLSISPSLASLSSGDLEPSLIDSRWSRRIFVSWWQLPGCFIIFFLLLLFENWQTASVMCARQRWIMHRSLLCSHSAAFIHCGETDSYNFPFQNRIQKCIKRKLNKKKIKILEMTGSPHVESFVSLWRRGAFALQTRSRWKRHSSVGMRTDETLLIDSAQKAITWRLFNLELVLDSLLYLVRLSQTQWRSPVRRWFDLCCSPGKRLKWSFCRN